MKKTSSSLSSAKSRVLFVIEGRQVNTIPGTGLDEREGKSSRSWKVGRGGRLSPKSLPGAVGPGAVVVVTADAVFAHGGEDLTGGGETIWVSVFFRVPQIGANDGAGALEIDGFNGDDDDGARGFLID